jgi:hypothetical protein
VGGAEELRYLLSAGGGAGMVDSIGAAMKVTPGSSATPAPAALMRVTPRARGAMLKVLRISVCQSWYSL